MDPNAELINRLTRLQLEGLLEHFERGGGTIYDREAAAKTLTSLTITSRLQSGEPVDISVVREGVSVEDMFTQLDEDQ